MNDAHFIKTELVVLVYNLYIDGLIPQEIIFYMSLNDLSDLSEKQIENIIDAVNQVIL